MTLHSRKKTYRRRSKEDKTPPIVILSISWGKPMSWEKMPTKKESPAPTANGKTAAVPAAAPAAAPSKAPQPAAVRSYAAAATAAKPTSKKVAKPTQPLSKPLEFAQSLQPQLHGSASTKKLSFGSIDVETTPSEVQPAAESVIEKPIVETPKVEVPPAPTTAPVATPAPAATAVSPAPSTSKPAVSAPVAPSTPHTPSTPSHVAHNQRPPVPRTTNSFNRPHKSNNHFNPPPMPVSQPVTQPQYYFTQMPPGYGYPAQFYDPAMYAQAGYPTFGAMPNGYPYVQPQQVPTYPRAPVPTTPTQQAPSPVPRPAPTPVKRGGIKIVNPDTKEEVKLPNPPASPARPSSVTSTPRSSTVAKEPTPGTPSLSSTPRKAVSVVLKDPKTGSVVSVVGKEGEKPETTEKADVQKEKVDAEAKPVDAATPETKPAEVKPVEVKPAEVKPAEVKPVEEKPVEAKPVEVKPVEVKAEVKASEEKAAPAQQPKSDVKPLAEPKEEAAPVSTPAPVTAVKEKAPEVKPAETPRKRITPTPVVLKAEEPKKEEQSVPTPAEAPKAAVEVPKAGAKVSEAAEVKVPEIEAKPKAEEKVESKKEPETEVTAVPETESKEAEDLEEGEIREDETTSGSATPTPEEVKESAKMVDGDAATAKPPTVPGTSEKRALSPRKMTSPLIDTSRPPMKRLESFEGVKYPLVSPTHEKGKPFVYNKDFLMQFASVVTEKPPGLDLSLLHSDDKGTSPKNRHSIGPGRPLPARGGSQADMRSGRTSEERFHASMAARGGMGVQGVMSSMAVPPPGRISRTGSGGGRMPPMSRQTSYRGDGSRDPRRSRGSRHEPPPPLEAPVVLQRSENAWKPATLAGSSKKDLSALDEEEKARIQLEAVLKQCKGLLNKLTVEKFDTISDKILHLDMVNETILGGVIDTIFEKSLDEVNFQSMYARLCSKLSSQLPVIQKWIHSDMKTNTFRRALLAKCQTEFEKGAKWAADEENLTQIRREARKRLDSMTDEEKLKIAEEDFERQRIKRRVLGNIQFIGHLFRESLITEKIMHQCIQQLLANVSEPEEEDLESLSKFLVTIGEKLDHERAKHHMDSYISRITELSTNLKVSSRIRFMLLDVLELRRNGWKGKNAPSGPKTIAEIHQEAAQKAREEEERMRRERSSQSSRGGLPSRDQQFRDRRGGGRGSQDSRVSQTGTEGWQTSGGRQSASMRVTSADMSRMGKISIAKVDMTTMQLGPGGMMGSNRWNPKKAGTPLSRSSSSKDVSNDSIQTANAFDILGARRESVDSGRRPSVDHAPAKKEEPAVPTLTADQVKAKLHGIRSEFFSIFDVNEVKESLKELGTHDHDADFLDEFWNAVPEVKDLGWVTKTGELIATLVGDEAITLESLKTTLGVQLEFAEDNVPDCPTLYKRLGLVISRLLIASTLSLSDIHTLAAPLLSSKSLKPPAAAIVAETLKDITSKDGEEKAQELVKTLEGGSIKTAFWPEDRREDGSFEKWKSMQGLEWLE